MIWDFPTLRIHQRGASTATEVGCRAITSLLICPIPFLLKFVFHLVSVPSNKSAVVSLERPPSILVPLKLHASPKGYQCYMTCAVRGCPTPHVGWYHNGTCINSNHNYYVTNAFGVCSMYILRVGNEDSGEYKVVAVNSLGRAECSTVLNVKGTVSCSNDHFRAFTTVTWFIYMMICPSWVSHVANNFECGYVIQTASLVYSLCQGLSTSEPELASQSFLCSPLIDSDEISTLPCQTHLMYLCK